MFRSIKQVFIGLLSVSGSLTIMDNVSKLTTCISVNKQPCMTRSTLIHLNHDKYNQGLRYYPIKYVPQTK